MRAFLRILCCFLVFGIFVAGFANAQDSEEKSAIIKYVEQTLSTPNRQIRLNGLEGTLSSNVSLSSITIADRDGVWLEIVKPKLVWTRAALLRSRLEIDSLTAESIAYVRKPLPDENLPSPESSAFAIPELPVAVVLKKLNVPLVSFGPTVFGLEAEASVDGNVTLDSGSLDLSLEVNRLDGPGGVLRAIAKYGADKKTLNLDVVLEEPEDGIVASLAGITDRPPVSLEIKGDAPIDDLQVSLAFDVDSRRILTGSVAMRGTADGIRANAELAGPLSSIMSQRSRAFLGNDTRLAAELLVPRAGGLVLEDARLESGSVTLGASATALADGFLSALNVDLRLVPQKEARVVIPAGSTETSIAGAILSLQYDAESDDRWDGTLAVKDIRTPDFAIADISLRSGGTVANIRNAADRIVTFALTGSLNGIASGDLALSEALGQRITIDASGEKNSSSPLNLAVLAIAGDTFNINASGKFSDAAFDGELAIEAANLSALSTLAGRDLSGSTKLAASGVVQLLRGGFDLDLSGNAQSVTIGDERIDPLLKGNSVLSGGVARTGEGLAFRRFRVNNDQFEMSIDGRLASTKADLSGDAQIRDIALIDSDSSGAVDLHIELAGENRPFDLRALLQLKNGKLAARSARDLSVSINGKLERDTIGGAVSGQGFVGGESVSLAADFAIAPQDIAVQNLAAQIGRTALSGQATRGLAGMVTGKLDVKSSDIGTAAALIFVKASGAIEGSVELSTPDGKTQSAVVDVAATDLVYGKNRFGSAEIEAAIGDLFGKPVINANVSAANSRAAGVDFRNLAATARSAGDITDFDVAVVLVHNATRVTTDGQLRREGAATHVTLDNLQLRSSITDAKLMSPAHVQLRGDNLAISDFALAIGNGSARVSGTAGKTLDLSVALTDLPLNIANAIRPDTGAEGTIGGTVDIVGRPDAPEVRFRLDGNGVSVRQIGELGLSPLVLSATGTFAGRAVILETVNVSNSQGLAVSASGRIPVQSAGLNVAVNGSAPLSIVQPFLASRGAVVSGNSQFDLTVSGSLADPRPEGLFSVSGGTLSDPLSNLKLENIGLIAGLRGDQLSISQLQARLASGGNISASGTAGLADGFPANIAVNLTGARYTDGQTFSTTLDGQLVISGNLASDPVMSGALNLGQTEISVPESFASDVTLLKVDHVTPSSGASTTLARLNKATPAPAPTSRPSVLRLDLAVNAPNRIFVRGRGLDAELGGSIRLTGPVTNIQPVGRFDLRRGRLAILGQRLDLTEGSITMAGNLDPILDFVAQTRSSTVNAYIRLKGRASNLEITFSSDQGLPDDEVLARIVFGRSIGELTPVQIAKLASIAAELTGGSNVSLVERLRRGTGLDDLDVVQDDEGNSAVRAGKYVKDNVYLGVEAGKETEATINLDLTDNVKARGAVNSKGETSIGVFYEKDY